MVSATFRDDLHFSSTAGQPTCATLHLFGEVDLSTADELRRRLREADASAPGATVVVDLTGITFIGCAGLTPLVEAKKRLGDRLQLRAVPWCVQMLLTLTHLTAFFGLGAAGCRLDAQTTASQNRPLCRSETSAEKWALA